TFYDRFRLYVEDISVQFVDLFFADVIYLILRKILGRERERLDSGKVLHVLVRDLKLSQGWWREECNSLESIAAIVKHYVRDSMKPPRHRSGLTDGQHIEILG